MHVRTNKKSFYSMLNNIFDYRMLCGGPRWVRVHTEMRISTISVKTFLRFDIHCAVQHFHAFLSFEMQSIFWWFSIQMKFACSNLHNCVEEIMKFAINSKWVRFIDCRRVIKEHKEGRKHSAASHLRGSQQVAVWFYYYCIFSFFLRTRSTRAGLSHSSTIRARCAFVYIKYSRQINEQTACSECVCVRSTVRWNTILWS